MPVKLRLTAVFSLDCNVSCDKSVAAILTRPRESQFLGIWHSASPLISMKCAVVVKCAHTSGSQPRPDWYCTLGNDIPTSFLRLIRQHQRHRRPARAGAGDPLIFAVREAALEIGLE